MASETPIVTRSNKWKTLKDLVNYKSGFLSDEESFSPAIIHGQLYEDEARDWANMELGLMLEPTCIESGKYASSLDGIDTNVIAEIKCPWSQNSSIYKSLAHDKVRDDHYDQIQHQLYTVKDDGIDLCFYIVYNTYIKRGYINEVRFNENHFSYIHESWEKFINKHQLNI